jgi:hypothetical protein
MIWQLWCFQFVLQTCTSIKAAFLSTAELHGLFDKSTLQKDVNSWADYQGACFRAHCVYTIRLWRKTPDSSKTFSSITYKLHVHVF